MQTQFYKANNILRESLPEDILKRYDLYLKNQTTKKEYDKEEIEINGMYGKAFCIAHTYANKLPEFTLHLSNLESDESLYTFVHELGHISETRYLKNHTDSSKIEIGSGLQIHDTKTSTLYGSMLNECIREVLTINAFTQNPKMSDLSDISIDENKISPVYAPFINLTQMFLFATNTNHSKTTLTNYKDNLLLNSMFNDALIIEKTFDKFTEIDNYKNISLLMDQYCNSDGKEISEDDFFTIVGEIRKFHTRYTNSLNISQKEKENRFIKFDKLKDICFSEFFARQNNNLSL